MCFLGVYRITWFALLPEAQRNDWLRYAWNWVKQTDALEQLPCEPAKLTQPNCQEQEWETQPQTAALPGGSSATELLGERFVGTAHHAPFQSPELDAAQDRERQTDHCRRQPVAEIEHCVSSFVVIVQARRHLNSLTVSRFDLEIPPPETNDLIDRRDRFLSQFPDSGHGDFEKAARPGTRLREPRASVQSSRSSRWCQV